MFKFISKIPLAPTIRTTTSGWSKPIPPPVDFKVNHFPKTTRSFHQVKLVDNFFKNVPKIISKTHQTFQMKIVKKSPQSIQIRCFAEEPATKPKTDSTPSNVSANYVPVANVMFTNLNTSREQVMRYINATLSLLVTVAAMNYGSLSLFIAGAGGFVMSVFGNAIHLSILMGLLLVLLAVVTLFPALVVSELVDISLQLQKLALSEIALDERIMDSIGTPITINPQSMKEKIYGTTPKDTYAELLFEITGPNGIALVDIVGHSIDGGVLKKPGWELRRIRVEKLDENHARTGKVIYENRRESQTDEPQLAHA